MQDKEARSLLEKHDVHQGDHARSQEQGKEKKTWVTVVWWSLSILLWAGVMFGGYTAAEYYANNTRSYVDDQLATIQAKNEETLTTLDTTVSSVKDELVNVQKNLAVLQTKVEETGQGISGNDETKAALQGEVDKLTKQLKQLQQSLAKLEEAANG
ncbi:hypothetical protein [Litoribacterium kuwaitense]|uniref:hypothetical protein n=1 Tax=Litoribacterium kuwaitense TaxID=1398745 RepID=UPI001FE8DF34|nr:hypothetical protein [Litoribacterium kuwaitense]